jgi:hypothetical protein
MAMKSASKVFWASLLWWCLLLLIPTLAWSAPGIIEEINAAIQAKAAERLKETPYASAPTATREPWVASETAYTNMSMDQFRRMCKAQRSDPLVMAASPK